jgi:hypothetical protein
MAFLGSSESFVSKNDFVHSDQSVYRRECLHTVTRPNMVISGDFY